MSVLRLSGFLRKLPAEARRSSALLLTADSCGSCSRLRSSDRIPGWMYYRRHYAAIPKKSDRSKQLWERSQLIDVLEARIQQLQSDVILDVKHSKVEFLKLPHKEKRPPAGKSKKVQPGEKAEPPKAKQSSKKGAAQTSPSSQKTHGSRWSEKLDREKLDRTKKYTRLQKKFPKQVVNETVEAKSDTKQQTAKRSKGKKMLPGTSTKIIFPVKKSTPAVSKETVETAAAEKLSGEADVAEFKELYQIIDQCSLVETESVKKRDDSETQLSACCYLEACVYTGDVERAQRFLLLHHRNLSKRSVLTVRFYNTLMKMWAKKGALPQISKLFVMLAEAELKPDAGSYSAVLECMGRMPESSTNLIERCLEQMKEDGLCVDDVFSQCLFRLDERDMVLKAVRDGKPDYEPPTSAKSPQCSLTLVKDFYAQREDVRFPKMDFELADLQERFKQQLAVEQANTITIDSVEAIKPVTENMTKMRKLLEVQYGHWQRSLLQALRESKQVLKKGRLRNWKTDLYPLLCVLHDEEYVKIMLQTLENLPPTGDSLVNLAKELGSRVYSTFCIQQKIQMVKKMSHIYNSYAELLAKDTESSNVLPRERWIELEAEMSAGPSLLSVEASWPHMLLVQLGCFLANLLVCELKIPNNILNPELDNKLIPILYHMYIFRNSRQIGFIKPHPILVKIQSDATVTKLTFDSYVMPMLCPPIPWTSPKSGAYLLTPTKLMRAVDGANQHQLLLEKCQNEDLHAVLDSLNQLGNCAWKINKPMLDIIISIFNDKGCDKLDIPPPLTEAPEIPRFNPHDQSYTIEEKAHLKQEIMKARKKYGEMHSLRMDALYKLSIANHMRDEIFWFPHNMDFRGRTYPCPPYLNHLGSDITRCILLFAEGKPLGPTGLDWLKIHLVNLTGLKKRSSLAGRLEYANSIMDDILDSADNPLTGRGWWMSADEPWQCLACCKEIASAHRSPDHTEFISYFPVHQDGSCNGLQHYAALGRDVIGATSVNLMPCEEPQDVYSGVAQQVEEFRKRDAAKGLKTAIVLEGFINRKVVKQTVMTVVYGVTRYGGRLQIEKRLKEIDDFPKEYLWDASHYLVQQVFSSLKEMFTGTREIQNWLTESARLISKSGSTVEWVTPLGLPIVQPYHRSRSQLVRSNIQMLNVQISYDVHEKPDTMKQKNAFPPNFIHSLDSTHMMLTALYCYSAGVTFVSVHDCFWTHPITVDTMNKVCREQFVSLHNQPILQNLSEFLLQKYCSGSVGKTNKAFLEFNRMQQLLARVPETGDFDLQRVKDSTYFFS
ncbi:DNA-directed RNA polymerase, mitochondrial [Astyanax mexicanus]|uniref:DNA-directed RNA polymerase n=1 Tax=Astyanax mexicanus TaxID=7994 RepID=A0A8T2L4L6_ASTMX|nr:DNA-directed RNA polymerase, mitochondrial [Astyanax mexicanus]